MQCLIGQDRATVSERAEYRGLKRALVHSLDGAAVALVTDARQREARTIIVGISFQHAPGRRCWSHSYSFYSVALDFACARPRRLIERRRQQPPLLQIWIPRNLRSFQALFQWKTVFASVSRCFLRLQVFRVIAPLPTCAARSLASRNQQPATRSSSHSTFTNGHTRKHTVYGTSQSGPEAWPLHYPGSGTPPLGEYGHFLLRASSGLIYLHDRFG
jgi:hypothetical protein